MASEIDPTVVSVDKRKTDLSSISSEALAIDTSDYSGQELRSREEGSAAKSSSGSNKKPAADLNPAADEIKVEKEQKIVGEILASWEPPEWIRIQRNLDGCDPDNAEFERLRLAPSSIVDHELNETYRKRQISIENLSMKDLSDKRVMNVMSQARDFRIWYVSLPSSSDNLNEGQPVRPVLKWKGCIVATMRSAAQAEEAVIYLKSLRSDIIVKAFSARDDADEILRSWRENQGSTTPYHDAMEELLIVTGIGANTTEDEIRRAFPLADDVVIARERPPAGSRELGRAKGYAYLTFGDIENLNKCYDTFGRRIRTEENKFCARMKLMRYRPPVDIPPEYLRLRRRFRILTILRQLNACDTEDKRATDGCKKQLVEHIHFWMDKVEDDDVIRKRLGLQLYTLEELHELLDIQKPQMNEEKHYIVHMINMSNKEKSMLEELVIKLERTRQQSGKFRDFGLSAARLERRGKYADRSQFGKRSALKEARKRIEKYITIIRPAPSALPNKQSDRVKKSSESDDGHSRKKKEKKKSREDRHRSSSSSKKTSRRDSRSKSSSPRRNKKSRTTAIPSSDERSASVSNSTQELHDSSSQSAPEDSHDKNSDVTSREQTSKRVTSSPDDLNTKRHCAEDIRISIDK